MGTSNSTSGNNFCGGDGVCGRCLLAVVEVKGQFLSKAKTTLQGLTRNKTLKEV